jgi:hypothetical protein
MIESFVLHLTSVFVETTKSDHSWSNTTNIADHSWSNTTNIGIYILYSVGVTFLELQLLS